MQAVASRFTLVFIDASDELCDWRFYLFTSVENDLMAKACHHDAKTPHFFGVGAVCKVFSDLRVRQAYYMKSHESPDSMLRRVGAKPTLSGFVPDVRLAVLWVRHWGFPNAGLHV